jgi:hypothetical protein
LQLFAARHPSLRTPIERAIVARDRTLALFDELVSRETERTK